METQLEPAAQERRGVPTFAVEAAVALLILVLGLVVLFGSRKLGSGWTSDGPGAGYFPFYIGIILCISALGAMVQALFGKTRNTEIFVDSEQLRRVLMVLLPAALYVLAVQFLGIYIASAIYISGFMIFLGKFHKGKSIATGVVIAVFFFVLFEIWFKVPLAKGRFDLLGFLGY